MNLRKHFEVLDLAAGRVLERSLQAELGYRGESTMITPFLLC
jgi:hypothetical protein